MALRKNKKAKKRSAESSVNITPLLDVLTVLLFFLIKSMSMSSLNLWVPDDLRLPASISENPTEEAVVVSLTASKLYVDNKEILELDNKTGFAKRDIASDERTIIPLKMLLDEKVNNRNAFFEGVGDVKELEGQKILIQVDKELPFGVIKYMLHTVSQAGYTDYKFIAMPQE